ncbi:DUF4097 family beta strand repeat-containing protein [Streptomyces sp. NPDC087903]|uniref:DUF4097 family beta strand repeat-containing protein n=1 Tax=Streptomyces sp. NPDC087903 TaxID=3365819 RepID=UPI00380C1FA4
METVAKTTTYVRRLAVALVILPLVGACGGGNHTGTGGDRPIGRPGTRLVITTDNGLRLRPADGDRVDVDRNVGHHWTHDGDTWVMDLSCAREKDADDRCPRMPEVDVPSGVGVTVTARNAGIDAAGVSGALDLTTVNGDVTVTRAGDGDATVRLSTRNGSVRAVAVRAGALHAATVNGDVVLTCATSPTGVSAVTTNGSVGVLVPHDAPAYRVTARTDNGRPSVTVPTDAARDDRTMTLTTVNGDVGAGLMSADASS